MSFCQFDESEFESSDFWREAFKDVASLSEAGIQSKCQF